jgi:hypothetical protein
MTVSQYFFDFFAIFFVLWKRSGAPFHESDEVKPVPLA